MSKQRASVSAGLPAVVAAIALAAWTWAAGAWAAGAWAAGGSAAGAHAPAFVLDLAGPIGPATADYVTRGIDRAEAEGAALAVLRIDTPGGLDASMRQINARILAARIPVVGFVGPSGARAASAGTYILYATHVAAMAPGTNLGAATPVQIGGGGPFGKPGGERTPTEAPGSEATDDRQPAVKPGIEDKAMSDAAAYLRSLAQLRGRNVDWAEKAVTEAASLSASDALAAGVADLLADSVPDLLAKLDGRRVVVGGAAYTLATTGIPLVEVTPDWRTKFLATVTNPNVVYILMLLGIYGLILEFYNPGVLVPGIVGAISLLLALYGLQILPVDYVGMALMLVGLALIVAEAFVPSFGALGLGGIAAFVIGSVMLFDSEVPGFNISWTLIGSTALVSGGGLLALMIFFMRSRGRRVVTGPEQMVGQVARVLEWSGGEGRVHAHGEAWQAVGRQPFAPGVHVLIEAVEGLTLRVGPAAGANDAAEGTAEIGPMQTAERSPQGKTTP